jgi:filamentous hemagglutinin family protein
MIKIKFLFSFQLFSTLLILNPVYTTWAQVVPDVTMPVNSNLVHQNGNIIIQGGTTRGSNLFHSFKEFSVQSGTIIHFNNDLSIKNIFSRVTGGSISQIDGLIRANGKANLFLLNPNELNIGGSFFALTARSIDFADGSKFSAIDSQNNQLLTVSEPIGLEFGLTPGTITVQGLGNNSIISVFAPYSSSSDLNGLKVTSGNTLALIGGKVNLEGGLLLAPGGRIEIGGVSSGQVMLNSQDWNFNFDGILNFQDIQLSQRALVDAGGLVGGSITLNARNVKISDGSAVIIQSLGLQHQRGIHVNASESLFINGTSPNGALTSTLLTESIGNGRGANITISTKNLVVENGGGITSRTFGSGAGGDINIKVPGFVQVLGFSPTFPNLFSNISAATFGLGNSGNVTLSTDRLNIDAGGDIGAATFGLGLGGDVKVNARDITLNGVVPNLLTPSVINAAAFNSGNAGSLTINTSRLFIQDGGRVSTTTVATGDAGRLIINASDFIVVSGTVGGSINPSLIDSSANILDGSLQRQLRIPSTPSGNSGNVSINTNQLLVTNGGQISIKNDGTGNAGFLNIEVNNLSVTNRGGITAITRGGNGGTIRLNSNDLIFLRDGTISTTANGRGVGGDISITSPLFVSRNGTISANAKDARGGNIKIDTFGLFIDRATTITATSALGTQFGGNVQVNTGSKKLTEPNLPNLTLKDPEIQALCQQVNNPRLAVQSLSGQMIPVNPIANSQPSWSPPTPNTIPPTENPTVTPAVSWKTNSDGTISFIAAEEYLERLQNKVCKSK